jgi:short-subunit dehydrogenase
MNMILAVYLIIGLLALIHQLFRRFLHRKISMIGKNIVITGGSSGVGLSIAQQCLSRGASKVVLIARDKTGLAKAVDALTRNPNQEVCGISADVSNWNSLESAFREIHAFCGDVDYLFANAGFAKPGLLSETSESDICRQLNVNYTGAAFATQLCQPLMPAGSHIVYSGSICSIISFAGYSGYGPSKYALRGLAETLRNELKSSHISIHLCLISPVDTPGFHRENETKPEVCCAIEGTATLLSPDDVAGQILTGIDRGDYCIIMEALTGLILELNAGIIPSNNIFLSLLIAPFLPLIRWGAVKYIDFLARNPTPHIKSE